MASYDHSKPLNIDPVLSYSTYLGGNSNDPGNGIAVDSAGNAYVTGSTGSTNFPTASPVQATFGGGVSDAFITKLNAAGNALAYSTYLGGSGEDEADGIAVDSSGDAYVTGFTYSPKFPTATPIQATLGSAVGNAFVTKLNAAGSTFIYSTYLGGSRFDHGYGIAVDSVGNAYVTGQTGSTNFPTTNTFQSVFGGGLSDAFVTKFNAAGNAYVTGLTNSTNFPTASPLQAAFGGGTCGTSPCSDAFVTKLNASGSALVYSAYLGGSGNDGGLGIAVNSAGNAYMTGSSSSNNFPTAIPFQAALGGPVTAFVTQLNAAGSALVYSSYLGGSGGNQGVGIAVDSAGNTYVIGTTQSGDFPTVNPFQAVLGGIANAFIAKISPANVPGVSLTPSRLTFSNQVVSTASTAQTVTLRNVGSAALTTSISASGDFTQTNTCGTGIAGGTTCTISV